MIQQKRPYGHVIILIFVIFLASIVINANQKQANNNVYSVHNIKFFKNDSLAQTMGCDYRIAYGYFQHPEGALDALHIMTEPGRYALGQNCRNPEKFAHLFGSNQNYNHLLQQNPEVVVGKIKVNLGRIGIQKVILNWNFLYRSNFDKVHNFLDQLIKGLEAAAFTVYLKAPASFFCYTEEETRYILGVKAKNFIIQMYGENIDAYTNYDEIFTNTDTRSKFQKTDIYPQENCSQYPSLAMLKKFDGNFFIGATLEKQQPGYHGLNMDIFVKKAEKDGVYKDYVFYDHLSFNLIPV